MTKQEYVENIELREIFPFAVCNFKTGEVQCLFINEEYALDFIDYQLTLNTVEKEFLVFIAAKEIF